MKNVKLFEFAESVHGEEMLSYGFDAMYFEQCLPNIIKHPVYREGFYVYIIVEDGCARLNINGRECVAVPGTVLFGMPGEIWVWEDIPDIKGKVVVFMPQFLLPVIKGTMVVQRLSFMDKNAREPLIPLSPRGVEWINNVTQEMIYAIEAVDESNNTLFVDLMRARLWYLMLMVEKEFVKNVRSKISEKTPSNLTVEFINLVGEYMYVHHSVAFYADRLCVTPNYLNKISKVTLGMSTRDYIMGRVVAEAKGLLDITEMTVSEVSHAMGFATPNYFARFFKKQTGLTPMEYRNRIR